MKRHAAFFAVGLLGVILLALILPSVEVCRDWAFVDVTNGSRKGHREWCWGARSGEWSRTSALELFQRSHDPDALSEWISYAGTGRNVFGGATVKGHGRPGAVLMLRPETIDEWCRLVSDAEKRRALEVLSGGDATAIRTLVAEIHEFLLNLRLKERNSAEASRSE